MLIITVDFIKLGIIANINQVGGIEDKNRVGVLVSEIDSYCVLPLIAQKSISFIPFDKALSITASGFKSKIQVF